MGQSTIEQWEDNLRVYIVTNSQVLFHNGSLLHSKFNTQLLITVHNLLEF
jgi:hypothetical protein